MNGFGTSPLEIMATDAMLQGLIYCDEFSYSAQYITGTATALGSLGTVDVQVQINGDSDFIVQEQNLTAFDNATPPVIVASPNLLATIVRAGSGREIMNQADHVLNLFGSFAATRFPGRKPITGLIQANNTLTVRLQNLSTTVFSRVSVTFRGFKVFYTVNPASKAQGNRQDIFHAL